MICITGRCIIPATLILNFVKDVAIGAGAQAFGMDGPIQSLLFENIKFLPMTELKLNTEVKISISIELANGKFKVCEGTKVIASGSVKCIKDSNPMRDVQTFYNKKDLPILNSRDVYKEFRLRGYNFADQFKSIKNARMDGCYGQIKCSNNNNLTTVMDAMIQLIVLSKDTRLLHVPQEIRRIRININDHLNCFNNTNDRIDGQKLFDAYYSNELSTIVCGGIEMSGVTFIPVERIKPDGLEVLQTYQFVPLIDAVALDFNDAASICIELALEKIQKEHVTLIEVLSGDSKPSIECLYEVFRKMPLIFANLTLLTEDNNISLINNKSIKCEYSSLEKHSEYTFIVLNKCMENDKLVEMAKHSLSNDGFLIFIDDKHSNAKTPPGFTLISQIKSTEVTFTLMQLTPTKYKNDDFKIIQIDSDDEHFNWLQKLQETNALDNVLLVAQNDKTPGVLGLINCLRLEPDTNHLRCVIIEDERASSFDTNYPLYKRQLDLQLPINVYRNGKWGTYRHLELKQTTVQCESEKRMTVNVEQVDDLRSLHWVPVNELRPSNEIVKVQFAALNFCDRLIASGSLPNHTIIKNRLDEHRSLLGFECAGITENGKRVMCISLGGGSLSTHLNCENADIILEIPNGMSLRDAATIPFSYFTVYCSFFIRDSIKPGQSILINAACNGVGLAAIHVALAYGLNVFAAVPTQQKKEFFLNNFPKLKGKD